MGTETLLSVPLMNTETENRAQSPNGDIQGEAKREARAIKGHAQIELGIIVTGWCVNSTNPLAPVVISAIDANGMTLAEALAKPAIAPASTEMPPHSLAFRMRLPASLLDGNSHSIALLVNGTLGIFPPLVVDGKFLGVGFIDEFSAGKIRGWAISFVNSAAPVLVEALVDGIVVGSARADEFRPDVAAEIRTSGFQGFHLKLWRPLLPHENVIVRLPELGWQTSLNLNNLELDLDAAPPRLPVQKSIAVDDFRSSLDKVEVNGARGWAMNLAHPNQPVILQFQIEGVTVAHVLADAPRPDVGLEFNTNGRHGFHVSFPPGLGLSGKVHVGVKFDANRKHITKSPTIYEMPARGLAHPAPTTDDAGLERYLYKLPRHGLGGEEPSVDIIVLNRDGASYLEDLFKSFRRYNSYDKFKFIIIDHGSTDNSQLVCRDWASRLNIDFIPRGYNFSFSASNNVGVDISDGDIVFFINNDIVFAHDILQSMVRYFRDPEIGIVGIKLRSMPDSSKASTGLALDSFVQHTGIKFDYGNNKGPLSAYELPLHPDTRGVAFACWEVPAVTAAALMMRRSDFLALGGFDEGYFYGYEDVDLNLSMRRLLGKRVICANEVFAYHVRGATRTLEDHSARMRFEKNFLRLVRRHGAWMRRALRRDSVDGGRFYRLEPLRVAFAVSATDMGAPEADYFTAYELGQQLVQLYGWNVSYLPQGDWYNLDAVDVVIVMRHDFDPRKIARSNWNLTRIAWPRNWFEKWLDHTPWIETFDMIWTASKRSVSEFKARTSVPVEYFPIATSAERFSGAKAVDEHRSDYCFTGSFFNAPREIINCLQPEDLSFTFALYGHNWDQINWLAPYWRGSLSYEKMAEVYGSTRIVLDDANHTVKAWGSVNSRVFDALCAGCLVITNGKSGNDDVFRGLLPTYSSGEELSTLLKRYLEDDEARNSLVAKARKIVLESHTYRRRAASVHAWVNQLMSQKRFLVYDHSAADKPSQVASLIADALRARGVWTRLVDRSLKHLPVERLGDDVVVHVATQGGFRRTDQTGDQTHVGVFLGAAEDLSLREARSYDVLVLADAVTCNATMRGASDAIPLFASSEEAAASLSIDERGAFIVYDGRSLAKALDNLTPILLAKIDEFDATTLAPRRSERFPEPAGKPERLAERKAIDLFYWPDYSSTNPYQRMLYRDLPANISARPGSLEYALAAQMAVGRVAPVVFHLHWTSPIIGSESLALAATHRVDAYLHTLAKFRAAGGKLVWTIHNLMPHETLFPDLEVRLSRALAEAADAIHVHSSTVAALAAEHYRLPDEKIVVGAHGSFLGCYPATIDRAAARARLGLPEDAPVFLFFGQVRGYKGIDDLLDAFECLDASRGPRPHLVIAGKPVAMDPKGLIERAAEIEGVHTHLREIPDEDIQIFMRAADFVVLPYRKVLTSGSVYLALSFGVPVIAPRSGLVPEVVRETEGFLYDPDVQGGLAAALRRAVALNALELQSLSEAAYARACALDWSEIRRVVSDSALAATVGRRVACHVDQQIRNIIVAGPEDDKFSPTRVAAIVLHYKHIEDTVGCVISLLNQKYPSMHIYIVSNDENLDAFIRLTHLFPLCTIIQSPGNIGYAGGNNIALALARKREMDYFWIVNPDAVAPPEYIRNLIAIADTNDNIAIFGSAILFGDKPETVWFAGGKVSFEDGLETTHLHIGKNIAEVSNLPIPSDYITGASLLARTSVLDLIGYIPERYFLYFEESDWCVTAKRRGLAIVTYPSLRLFHNKRSEEGGAPTLTFLYYYCRNALLMCAKFRPDKIGDTEQRVREKAAIWLQRVAETKPNELERAKHVVEKAIAAGHAGETGRVDFLVDV